MKPRAHLLLPCLLLALLAAPAAGQDANVNGQWTLDFDTPETGPISMNLIISQVGSAFAGGGDVMGFEVEVADGAIEGSAIVFLLHVDADGQWITVNADAEVAGDEMTGNFSVEGMMSAAFTGKRAGQRP